MKLRLNSQEGNPSKTYSVVFFGAFSGESWNKSSETSYNWHLESSMLMKEVQLKCCLQKHYHHYTFFDNGMTNKFGTFLETSEKSQVLIPYADVYLYKFQFGRWELILSTKGTSKLHSVFQMHIFLFQLIIIWISLS